MLRLENLVFTGSAIPHTAIKCPNLGGIDYRGEPFQQNVTVARGEVGALWVTVDVPVAFTSGGSFHGEVSLAPADLNQILFVLYWFGCE